MEDILTPQICMDVDEIPLDIGKGKDNINMKLNVIYKF